MSSADHDPVGRDRLTATWVELIIRLGVLGLLLFFAFTLIRPFITMVVWSVVLTVALYPVYDRMVGWLGGRRRLAALLLTLFNLLIVIGPATWLTLGLIDSIRDMSEHLDLSSLVLPPPPVAVKTWPIIGNSIYQFWELASTNVQAALVKDRSLAETDRQHPACISPKARALASSSSLSQLSWPGSCFRRRHRWSMQFRCFHAGSLQDEVRSSFRSPEPPSGLCHVV